MHMSRSPDIGPFRRTVCVGTWAIRLPMLCLLSISATRADVGQGPPKVGDIVPDASLVSIEGMEVSLRPPAGKLLHIHFWTPDDSGTDELAKSAIVLYRRFHAKGLNALTVSLARNESRSLGMAQKWNLPWPVILRGGGPGVLQDLGIKGTQFSMVVNDQGKVVAVGLNGEPAHQTVAKLLNVDLADLPLPEKPEPRNFRKSREPYRDDRDLVHGNAKVYIATAPLSDNRVQLVWSARGLPGGAGHWKDNYTVYMLDQHELFETYTAELQVAHDFSKTFHRIATVPAESQHYVWFSGAAGKLLWYRLVLRDNEGRVAAISDVAPGVIGPNLVPGADLEQPIQAAANEQANADGQANSDQQANAWSLVARRGPASKWYEGASVSAGPPRPFSPGKQSLSGEAQVKMAVGLAMIPAESKQKYLLGGWLRVNEGAVTFERTAFDTDKRAIGGAETLRAVQGGPWVFCSHRLVANEKLEGNPSTWEPSEPEQANTMPNNQALLRPQVFGEAGSFLLDDTFLIAYVEADESTLAQLPEAESVKKDGTAAEEFAIRRETAIEKEEAAQQ